MASVYLVNVIGDGVTMDTAYRPDVPDGTVYTCLMLHPAKMRALILSPTDAIVGATRLVQAADVPALRAKAKTTSPTAAQRTTIQTWMTANGYGTLPAGVTWAQVIHFIARQVNPAADLDATGV
jgi:hypothetical protein